MLALGLCILGSALIMSGAALKIAERFQTPVEQPTFEPERHVEPEPTPIAEPEPDGPPRRIDNDPEPVGGFTPRVRRL